MWRGFGFSLCLYLTYTISEYERLKKAGETVSPINKHVSDLAEKWLSSSSFQDGSHNIPISKQKQLPKKAVWQISLNELYFCPLSESFKLANLGYKLYKTLEFW